MTPGGAVSIATLAPLGLFEPGSETRFRGISGDDAEARAIEGAKRLAESLLFILDMKHEAHEETGTGMVVLVGGNGGMSERYREVLEERGLTLRHFEKRVPNGTRRTLGRIAAVFVVVGMVSHSLRDRVKELAHEDTPVVYLRTASVSALRAAVDDLETSRKDPAADATRGREKRRAT